MMSETYTIIKVLLLAGCCRKEETLITPGSLIRDLARPMMTRTEFKRQPAVLSIHSSAKTAGSTLHCVSAVQAFERSHFFSQGC